jgi:hypothetical protein
MQLMFAVPAIGVIGAIGRDSLRKRMAARRGTPVPTRRKKPTRAHREPVQSA